MLAKAWHTKDLRSYSLGQIVFILAHVLAPFYGRLGMNDLKSAVFLGLWVWVGFQATLLLGSVIHEDMPWKLYAIHAGDALVKSLLMAVILEVRR